MSVAVCFVLGLAGSALVGVWIEIRRCLKRKRLRRERIERLMREDLAWRRWCASASEAIRDGRPVPPWGTP